MIFPFVRDTSIAQQLCHGFIQAIDSVAADCLQVKAGIAGVVLCFIYAMIYWPVWAFAAKALISATAAKGLAAVDAKTAGKFIATFAEGTFFWCAICAWIWASAPIIRPATA